MGELALLENLNQAQLQAVTTTEGFVRVIAGAGSGKTRALTHRFAYLVNVLGVLPSNILCVTFTNKAASEMRQRIRQLTGDNDTGFICTFHSFCVSVLQEDAHVVHYPEHFLVLDNGDIDAMLQLIYEERGLTSRHKTFKQARDMFEIRKLFKEPDYYHDMLSLSLEALHQKYLSAEAVDDILFYGYLYQEKKCFGLDYNDLINFCLHIFTVDPAVREKWQRRLEYIMIDEFQDIDAPQYKLMSVLCAHHRNLFVVGDPDQTIYTWRGANVKYLVDFEAQFAGTQTIMMVENYRSTPQILAAANSLIDKNTQRVKKSLVPVLPAGEVPKFYHATTPEDEAKYIAGEIANLRGRGVRLSDVAVLYRAHYVSRAVEEVFQREQLPYVLYSGVKFYDRMEIKDALSYLRLLVYDDDLSFRRIVNRPRRNIGEKRMHWLTAYADAHGCSLLTALRLNVDEEIFRGTQAREFLQLLQQFSGSVDVLPVSELLTKLLDASGYEAALRTEGSGERLDNLAELKQSIYKYETTCGEEARLADYLAHIALFANADAVPDTEAVKLMTIHGAKGLEFPYVFLCGLNEGICPAKRTATREAMEEERRLAFVALTRAQQGLTLTDAEGQGLDGSLRVPSRFIFDIGKEQLDYVVELQPSLIKETQRRVGWSDQLLADTNGGQFAAGDVVQHPVLGRGVVQEVDTRKGAYIIQFDMLPTARAISFRVRLLKG